MHRPVVKGTRHPLGHLAEGFWHGHLIRGPASPWSSSLPGDLRITRLVLAICPVTAIPGSEPSQSCLTLTADAQVFLQAARLDDNRRCATYSTQVRQRARTAAIQRSHQHTELPGMTVKRPAAPLVRDEEAVPAACPIGRSTPGTHGHSRPAPYADSPADQQVGAAWPTSS